MNYREYGKENSKVIMLIHGGGLSWWNYRKEAQLLKNDYRVILPVLDGHADSDRPFVSIEDNASEIISFINDNFGGHILLLGGLSLGGQVLLEMLAQRSDICEYAIVESAAVIPSRFTHMMVAPAFGSCYGLIRNKRFAKIQFDSLHMNEDFFDDYYRDTCAIGKRDLIAFMKANTAYMLKGSIAECSAKVTVVTGEKENREVLRSADILEQKMPKCSKQIQPGLHHGEFSLNYAESYVQLIKQILEE